LLVAWDQALKITNFITYKWRKIYRGGGFKKEGEQ
jgi:hypothetical protein